MATHNDPASSDGAAGSSSFVDVGAPNTILCGDDDAADAIVQSEQVPYD